MTTKDTFNILADKISKEYFIDDSQLKVDGAQPVKAWNTKLLILNSIFKDSALILGEPGHGKTTAAKIISAITTGFPLDLYETAQLQGHPEQTKEELMARPDYGKLNQGQEKVIWQAGAYLPAVIIDEINRLPQGKQSVLLNWMQTSRATYLNDTFYTGKLAFMATANHPDDANHIIIPPLADRFATSIEFTYPGCWQTGEIEKAKNNAEKIKDKNITEAILNIVASDKDKYKKVEDIKKAGIPFAKKLKEQGLITDGLDNLVKDIQLPFTPEGQVFFDAMKEELNFNGKKGTKRSNEKADQEDNHLKEIASFNTENAVSFRAFEAIANYAKALAYLTGAPKVDKRHIAAVAPYILSHRLVYTDEFKAGNELQDRIQSGDWHNAPSQQQFLTQKLVQGIDKNYQQAVMPHVELLYAYLTNKTALSKEQLRRAEGIVNSNPDHPLLKTFAHYIKNK